MKFFIDENYFKGPKQNYITNKASVYRIDDIWSLDTLDLKDCRPQNNRFYRYILVIFDNFSEHDWTIPLKNKNAKTIKDSFENHLITSKRKPILNETDRGKEFYTSFFKNFLSINNLKHYSRKTFLGAVSAERFNRTILLKRPVFEKDDGNWLHVLSLIMTHYNNRTFTSTEIAPIQAILRSNEGYVDTNLLDKRKKINPKYKTHDHVRTTDSRKTFSQGGTFNWSSINCIKLAKLIVIQYRVTEMTIYQKNIMKPC